MAERELGQVERKRCFLGGSIIRLCFRGIEARPPVHDRKQPGMAGEADNRTEAALAAVYYREHIVYISSAEGVVQKKSIDP